MLELVSNTWKTNKVGFFLVAIPVLLLLLFSLFSKTYKSWLINSAKKILEKAIKKDKQLSEEINDLNREAEKHKANADNLAKKSDQVEEDDDADWNKKL